MSFKSAAELAAEARARVMADFAPPVVEMDRSTPVERNTPETGERSLERVRAFLTEANGKTLLTAPAVIAHDQFEKAKSPNPFFMYVSGAFVGADKPNRNKAFWTTSDLEIGEPTIPHGPLNWLHEERRIVGALVDAKLVKHEAEHADTSQNRIDAMGVVWKYIWPQEATVMEMAGEQGRLWYSMECVSNEVACVDHGCGSWEYLKVQVNPEAAGVCEHVRFKTGARRFVEPAFLGGAVIVPPVRPGWPDARMGLMKQAASYAERAFDEAGHPDIAAAEWERLMAQVLTFAGVTA